MSQLPKLKTSDSTGVRDISLPDSGGVVTRGNPTGFGSDEIQGHESAPAPIAEGPQAEGASAYKSITSPVTAHPSTGISVLSHPQLSAAHRHGSISHQDHKDVHTSDKCEMKAEGPGVETITSLASGPQKPATAELGKQAPMTSRSPVYYRDKSGKIKGR